MGRILYFCTCFYHLKSKCEYKDSILFIRQSKYQQIDIFYCNICFIVCKYISTFWVQGMVSEYLRFQVFLFLQFNYFNWNAGSCYQSLHPASIRQETLFDLFPICVMGDGWNLSNVIILFTIYKVYSGGRFKKGFCRDIS